MRVIVTIGGGAKHEYGNVLGIKTDGETYVLTIGYGIGSKVFEKSYYSGEWAAVEIDAKAKTRS